MPEKRIALVIGNAEYEIATTLQNPVNDADKMTEALDRLGFDVRAVRNCTINEFHKAFRDFSQDIGGATVALFFYSGHAVQYDGENYLIPVDAGLEGPEDLDRLAFAVTPQLAAMRSRAGVSLVFLDACRDDPFKVQERGAVPGTKGVVVKQAGLKAIASTELKDALIAFAAEQGQTATEGDEGGLSPFTMALVEHIETPYLGVTEMIRRVKKSVREATGGKQVPWSNDSLTSEFYFSTQLRAGVRVPPGWPDVGGLMSLPTGVALPLADKDAKPPSGDEDTNTVPAQPVVEVWSLAAAIESTARKTGPLLLGGMSTAVAFVLMLVSNILHLGWITYQGKQIGFMAAPNWSVTYTLLFPFYLCLFAALTERVKVTLASLVEQRLVVDAKGRPITEGVFFAAWKQALRKVSLLLWIMLVIIAIHAGNEWVQTCLMPFFGGKVSVIDWSTYATVDRSIPATASIAFSFMAYFYMAVALYVYLAILVYAATICFFLNTVADPTGEFRLVLRDATFGKRFSDIGMIIFCSAILGLGAGFLMRLQAVYLVTNYSIVTDLLFSDVLSWMGRLPPDSSKSIADTLAVPSSWTGLVEIMFTLLMVFAACFFLYSTLAKAKQYFLDNIRKDQWRLTMGIEHSKQEVLDISRQPFMAAVFPMYKHLGAILVGSVATGIFIGYGSIPLVTLAYVAVIIVLLPGLRKRSMDDQLDGAGKGGPSL
ncbi:caspase family protein [Bradyrhizobium sp. AUGA SZCCT0222]|uniref:caspase family protein n=1 Tax=Bradyrhizobium sp. AUGA SZCCT0222 TaxID=2807668 RepID=UPI001BAA5CB9|nr:caspase family protein [Bradyrhizobium sp. AUGA SZCCT0222]MBR1270534.1 caspase family protein [Bradyrhizobium sp. AUGA SZCCT0222]